MEKHDNTHEDSLSDNPQHDIRTENEILKLKLQAERGGSFYSASDELPPEVEAQFLKNIFLFEESFENAPEVTIYECIGKPEFRKVDQLVATEIETEISRIRELMQSKNIVLDVLGQYDPSVIYKFMTEELFTHKIRDINIPGYITSFIYEEFHPNHKLDIQNTAQQFFDHWFTKEFNENDSGFADQFVTANGEMFSEKEVVDKLRNCLDSYHSFTNIKFKGSDIHFEWNEEESKGMGHAEGFFSYDAILENSETMHVEGPFKLYMINEYGLWRIFYFVFPGFEW